VKVAGRWTYLYRAIDQHGQVIDVLLSLRRDLAAARRFFTSALRAGTIPAEVTTDRAAAYPRVLDELIPSALHTVEQYANNPVETDHGRLKARLRPMRGLPPGPCPRRARGDLQKDRRRQFVARCATGDWDGIVMSRSAFERIPLSAAEQAAYMERELDQMRLWIESAKQGEGLTVKRLEAALLRAEERLRARLDSAKDPGITFEATGVDYHTATSNLRSCLTGARLRN
jgi:PAS domain-containing protein